MKIPGFCGRSRSEVTLEEAMTIDSDRKYRSFVKLFNELANEDGDGQYHFAGTDEVVAAEWLCRMIHVWLRQNEIACLLPGKRQDRRLANELCAEAEAWERRIETVQRLRP